MEMRSISNFYGWDEIEMVHSKNEQGIGENGNEGISQ